MKINYKIKEGRNIKDCKIGDKVVFYKEGRMDWESDDWCKENQLVFGCTYTISAFDTDDLGKIDYIDLEGFVFSMSPNHFKLL